jgi:hypothetical protein
VPNTAVLMKLDEEIGSLVLNTAALMKIDEVPG